MHFSTDLSSSSRKMEKHVSLQSKFKKLLYTEKTPSKGLWNNKYKNVTNSNNLKGLTIRSGKSGSIVAIEVIFDFFTVTICEQKSDLKLSFRNWKK